MTMIKGEAEGVVPGLKITMRLGQKIYINKEIILQYLGHKDGHIRLAVCCDKERFKITRGE